MSELPFGLHWGARWVDGCQPKEHKYRRLQGSLVLRSTWPGLRALEAAALGQMLPQINLDATSRPACLLSKGASSSYFSGWGQ